MKNFVRSQYLASLNNILCLTPETHRLREEALIQLPAMLEEDGLELDDMSLDQLCGAYFICTYAHTSQKHRIKRSINKLLRNNLRGFGLHDDAVDSKAPWRSLKRDKPRCLIITNWFTSSHVMYRCFGKSFAAMRKHFECINICLHQTDYIAAQCFDKVIQVGYDAVPYHEHVRKLMELIRQQAPDIILYGDIAMHPFGVMLSNFRLAPLQATIIGHPAPTHSDFIDAYIVESSFDGYTPDFSERMIFYPKEQYAVREPLKAPRRFSKPQRINMIVPCSIHKVTFPFLQMLQRIQKETGARIHVTSNLATGNEMIAAQVSNMVPDVTYYPGMHYDEYMKLITEMDMFLLTYPFSGFSTVQDCISQGVPGVVMHGHDIASHQGLAMLDHCQSRMYGAFDEEAYYRLAVDVAMQHTLRESYADTLYRRFETTPHGPAWRNLYLFSSDASGMGNALQALWREKGA